MFILGDSVTICWYTDCATDGKCLKLCVGCLIECRMKLLAKCGNLCKVYETMWYLCKMQSILRKGWNVWNWMWVVRKKQNVWNVNACEMH